MNEKNDVFKRVLTVPQLFALYQDLSRTIVTKIDVKNLGLDTIAVDNSIKLLCEIKMIKYDKEIDCFEKLEKDDLDYETFQEALYARIQMSYIDALLSINQADLKYDEAYSMLYMKRNSISLDLSGLLVILEGIGKIEIRQNDVFILDKSFLDLRVKQNSFPHYHKSLEELKEQLDLNEKYGVEAELEAVKYEICLLKKEKINRTPERISEFYTNAGYDIVSYMHPDSSIPDKFIEVKSCVDDNWLFYLSRNELEVAKNKQDNYYLYLYSRKNRMFRIIRNPYNYLKNGVKEEMWVMEPQVYKVRSIEKLS